MTTSQFLQHYEVTKQPFCLSVLQKEPVKKNFVRGISYITGYHIVPDTRPDQPGCSVTYVTQSDPKGTVPVSFPLTCGHCLNISFPLLLVAFSQLVGEYRTYKSIDGTSGAWCILSYGKHGKCTFSSCSVKKMVD